MKNGYYFIVAIDPGSAFYEVRDSLHGAIVKVEDIRPSMFGHGASYIEATVLHAPKGSILRVGEFIITHCYLWEAK